MGIYIELAGLALQIAVLLATPVLWWKAIREIRAVLAATTRR
jgi:hypothetical protein